MTGFITAGMDLLNETNSKSERLGQIFVMNGRERKEVTKLNAGDLGAVVKLKDTHTNNTLSAKAFPIVYPPVVFPDPVIANAILAKSKGEEDKIGSGLHSLHEEDPTFIVHYDPETKQTVIQGQGELHLAIIIKRLKEKFGVDVDVVEPRIPYKETIKGIVPDAEYKHKKQSGGRGQYGHVHLKIEPTQRGTGFEFEDAIVGGVVPGRFVPAVEKGIVEALTSGVIAGYQVVDVKATLHYGSYHDVDSDDMSFKIAGKMAFRKGIQRSPADFARTALRSRSNGAGGAHGRCDGGSVEPARENSRNGFRQHPSNHPRFGSVEGAVQVFHDAPIDDAREGNP